MTIGKGPLHVKEHGIGGVGKGVLSYRLERYDENRKLHTVEIFRNAAAVDEYNNGIPKLGPLPWCLCCFCPASTPMTLCEGMTLAPPCCRQGWPTNGATTYGDPEECAKVTNDFGRTGKAMKAGELKEWAKEEGFSNPPTPEELVAKFVRRANPAVAFCLGKFDRCRRLCDRVTSTLVSRMWSRSCRP